MEDKLRTMLNSGKPRSTTDTSANPKDEQGENEKFPTIFHSGWTTVNRIPTKVAHFGFNCFIKEGFKPKYGKREAIIFVIPGFFGSIDYYKNFMEQINGVTGLPVIGISHGGHSKAPLTMTTPAVKTNTRLYTLWGQINHKLVFLHHYVPRDVPIIFIGHSIGAFMALQMLRMNPYLKVAKMVLLFPLVEHIGAGARCEKSANWLSVYRILVPWLADLIGIMGLPVQKFLLSLLLSQNLSCPDSCKDAIAGFAQSNCAAAIIELFSSSVQDVQDLDYELIERYYKFMWFYYGKSDTWIPKEFPMRVLTVFPEMKLEVLWGDVEHHFYLNEEHTKLVASDIAEMIRAKFLNMNLALVPTPSKQLCGLTDTVEHDSISKVT